MLIFFVRRIAAQLNDTNSNVTKPELIKMVLQQPEKWPRPRFNPSKTKVADLKHHLLNSGFTKQVQVAEDTGGEVSPHLALVMATPY
jgi:hypothetical protein